MFQYMSDVHLEFYSSPKDLQQMIQQIKPNAPVLLLAGDIGNPFESNYTTFLNACSSLFHKVFVIPGNHEYYQTTKTMKETDAQLKQVIAQFPNISLLGTPETPYEDYQGIRWIGTTLWTRIRKPQFTINDTKMIPDFKDIQVVNQTHEQCMTRLQDSLQSSSLLCVIMTHHLPFYDLILPQFRVPFYTNYNQWFATDDCDEMIQQHSSKIVAWVYGHTHESSIQTHFGIPFLCNPLGYPHERKITPSSFCSVYRPHQMTNLMKKILFHL
jgi:predicted phosphodiesterase